MTPELLRAVVEAISTVRSTSWQRPVAGTGYASTEQVTAQLPDLAGLRDRSLLLVGWHGALRRSELSSLTWGQVDWRRRSEGVVLRLMGSKTDKQNTGQPVPIPAEHGSDLCPVAALEAWQAACSQRGYWKHDRWQTGTSSDRPVFPTLNRHGHLGDRMSPSSVGLVISQRAAAVGAEGVTGHSLRRGLTQAAHLAGVPDSVIMQTTRHRSVNMVRTYKGDAGLLERAASRGLLAQ